jgi:hypothetical protein
MRLTYLQSKFPRALPTKDGGVLRTVAEARSYIIALPKPRAQRIRPAKAAGRADELG